MRLFIPFSLGLLLSFSGLFAQETIDTIKFSYDAAGNRIAREIIYYEGGAKSARVNKEKEEEPEFEQGLNVYPNPATHSIYVTLNEEVLEADRQALLVFDNLGKVLFQTQSLEQLNQIDIASFPNGTYILKLIYDQKHKEWIIVKQ